MKTANGDDAVISGVGFRINDCRTRLQYEARLFSGEEFPLTLCSGTLVQKISDFKLFDNNFFGILPRDARVMCPSRKLLLECAWEAMEQAGKVPLDLLGKPWGVFTGSYEADYRPVQDSNILSPVGMAHGDVSFFFGLTGISIVTDSACSSSIAGLYICAEEMRRGTIQGAFVAGSHVLNNVILHSTSVGLISRTGRCKTFDQSADGFQLAEGCASLLVERREGNLNFRCRLVACAMNNDGRSPARGSPLMTGQVACIQSALQLSGMRASEIAVYEAQGTGTILGDAVEIQSCAAVYGGVGRPLIVQAVKSIIGHTEAASGVMGLLKSAVMLTARQLPGQLNFKNLSNFIGTKILESSPFVIPLEVVSFIDGARIITAESHYSVGGTNSHTILEANHTPPPTSGGPMVGDGLICSAKSDLSLKMLLEAHRRVLIEQQPTSSYQQGSIFSRDRFTFAAIIFGKNTKELALALSSVLGKSTIQKFASTISLQVPHVNMLHVALGGFIGNDHGIFREEWSRSPRMGRMHSLLLELLEARVELVGFSAMGMGCYVLSCGLGSTSPKECIREYLKSQVNREDYLVINAKSWSLLPWENTTSPSVDALNCQGGRWWAMKWRGEPNHHNSDVKYRQDITFLTPASPLALPTRTDLIFLQIGRSALLRQVIGTQHQCLSATTRALTFPQVLLLCACKCKVARSQGMGCDTSLPTYPFHEKNLYTDQVEMKKAEEKVAAKQVDILCGLCALSVSRSELYTHADLTTLHLNCVAQYDSIVQKCAHCQESLGTASSSTFDNKTYHSVCFQTHWVCTVCKEGICEGEEVEFNGDKVHPHCIAKARQTKDKCTHCNDDLREDFLFFNGMKVHVPCLAPFRKAIMQRVTLPSTFTAVEPATASVEKDTSTPPVKQAPSDFLSLFFLEGDASFQESGLSSLNSVRFVRFLNEALGLSLAGNALTQYPSPSILRSFILSKLAEGEVRKKLKVAQGLLEVRSLPDPFSAAQSIWDSIQLRFPKIEIVASMRKGIVLTGAAGFLGTQICHLLLKQGVYEKIVCILRAKSNEDASERMKGALGVSSLPLKIVAFAGDVEKPLLGLLPELYAGIGQACKRVIHCAALVMWIGDYSDYEGANVIATGNVVEMAYRYSMGITYISTSGVNSSSGPFKDFSEDFDDSLLTLDYWLSLPFIQRAYSFSKFVGELLVHFLKSSQLTLVVRVPMLGPHQESGRSASDQYDVRMLVTFAKLGKYYTQQPGTAIPKLHWIPIDYAAECLTIVDAAAQRFNKQFGDNKLHLAHPKNGTPMSQIFRSMMSFGYDLQRCSREMWLQDVEDQALEAGPLLPIFYSRMDEKEVDFRSVRLKAFFLKEEERPRLKITTKYLWMTFNYLSQQQKCPPPVLHPRVLDLDLDLPVKPIEDGTPEILNVSFLQRHEFARGFVQLVLLCFLVCLVMIPVFPATLFISWIVNTVSVFLAPLGVIIFGLSSFLVFTLLKWVVLGRLRPCRVALWSSYFLRWWTVETARRFINLTVIGRFWVNHTAFAYLAYIILGASVHWTAAVRAEISDWDLIVLERGTGTESPLSGHWVMNGEIIFGQSKICELGWVGMQSHLEPGATLAAGVKLDDGSFLSVSNGLTGRDLGEVLGGSDTQVLEKKFLPCLSRQSIPLWILRSIITILMRAYVIIGAITPFVYFFIYINDHYGWLVSSLSAPALLALCLFAYLVEVLVCKWILLWRSVAGSYSWNGFFAFRRDTFLSVFELFPQVQSIIGHSIWLSFFLRLLGTSVGKSVSIVSLDTPEWDLVQLGDHSVSGAGVVYRTWLFEDSKIVLSCISVGRSCFVVGHSVLQAPLHLESHCTVAVGSVMRIGGIQSGVLIAGDPAVGVASVHSSRAFPGGRSVILGLMFSCVFWIILGVSMSCGIYAFFSFLQFFLVDIFVTRRSISFEYYDYFYAFGWYLSSIIVSFISNILILIQFSLAKKLVESFVPKRAKNLEVVKFLSQSQAMISFLGYAVGGSVFATWFARVSGATIGRGCYFDPDYISDSRHLKLDDGCVVNGFMEMGFADAIDESLPGVFLASGTVLQRGAIIFDGLVTGKNAIIMPRAVCDALRSVSEGEVFQGSPAQPLKVENVL